MHRVLLSEPAADDFKQLAAAQRSQVLEVMRRLQEHPEGLAAKPMKSSLLNTTLFEIRKAGIRLMYEMAGERAVVLTIRPAKSK